MSIALWHTRRQLPVGQGGFHSAAIGAGDALFSYVYDCGSSNRDALERELDTFQESHGPAPVDLLALSHLDDDHVNGVERLLANSDVDLVLLPYLSISDRLVLIAEDCFKGTLTESRWELAIDPEDWFKRRGARSVVHVLPAQPEPPGVQDLPQGLPEGPENGHLKLKGYSGVSAEELKKFPALGKESLVAASGAPLHVYLDSRKSAEVLWEFIPFCHPNPERARAFQRAVAKLFGIAPGARSFLTKLRDALRTKSRRLDLKELYDSYWSNHNGASLSLYSGPTFSETRFLWRAEWDRRATLGRSLRLLGHQHWTDADRKVGWLGTGDAPLRGRARPRAFETHYQRVLPNVGTFVLPHHGSKHNFSGDRFVRSLKPDFWCTSAGRGNRYGHPDRDLRDALSRRAQYVWVRQEARTVFTECFRWSASAPFSADDVVC